MRIALIHHSDDITNDYGAYLAALLDESAKAKEYLVKDYDHVVNARESIKEENVLLHIVIPAGSNFSLKYWYGYKLNRIFKKYQVDVAVCLYGVCTNATIKQVLVIPDVSLVKQEKRELLWQQFAAGRIKESLQAASTVLVYANAAKQAIESTGIESGRIQVLPYTAPEVFAPMEWHNKLYVKSRYAQNKEYFVGILPDHNEAVFIDLLKAFSKFKKWQQSGMKLVLLPKDESFAGNIYDKLETYKYREDVNLVNDADRKDTADLIAAAYALLHPALSDADLWPGTVALQCNTPVIATQTASLEEYLQDAAVLVPDKDYEAFGDELNRIYKDENHKTNMTAAAAKQAALYRQEAVIESLWQLM